MNRRTALKAITVGATSLILPTTIVSKTVKANDMHTKVNKYLQKLLITSGNADFRISHPAQIELATILTPCIRFNIYNSINTSVSKDISKKTITVADGFEMELKYCREGRWDILSEMINGFENRIKTSINDVIKDKDCVVVEDFTVHHDPHIYRQKLMGFYGFMELQF